MSVVRRETRRRWLLVAGGVAVLGSLPAVAAARPTPRRSLDLERLRARIRASAAQPHEGYAESLGALGLPQIPRLGQIAALLSGTTRMRIWYGGKDRWRTDVIDTGAERGTYQTPEGLYTWDYGDNQLTFVAGRPPGSAEPTVYQVRDQLVYLVTTDQPRLPRAADLTPPDLARRLLNTATGDHLAALPSRRVAGIVAAGLRTVPADPHSTIGSIDIWAHPGTGLPLHLEITARDAERPILVTRFLDVRLGAPAPDVLRAPERRDGSSYTAARRADGGNLFVSSTDLANLPDRLAGLPRGTPTARSERPPPGEGPRATAVLVSSYALYGTGLAQVAVLPLAPRFAGEVYRNIALWGQRLTFGAGEGVMIATPLLSVMAVRNAGNSQRYLATGLVDAETLRLFGDELASVRP